MVILSQATPRDITSTAFGGAAPPKPPCEAAIIISKNTLNFVLLEDDSI